MLIDEENTIMYGRFYQRVLKVPILQGLMGFFGKIGLRVIACQDKRVVTHIFPKNPAKIETEHLRVSDLGIVKQWKWKEEMQTLTETSLKACIG